MLERVSANFTENLSVSIPSITHIMHAWLKKLGLLAKQPTNDIVHLLKKKWKKYGLSYMIFHNSH